MKSIVDSHLQALTLVIKFIKIIYAIKQVFPKVDYSKKVYTLTKSNHKIKLIRSELIVNIGRMNIHIQSVKFYNDV